jgi:hypothetical protein
MKDGASLPRKRRKYRRGGSGGGWEGDKSVIGWRLTRRRSGDEEFAENVVTMSGLDGWAVLKEEEGREGDSQWVEEAES